MLTDGELDQIASDLARELPDTVTVRRQDGTTYDPDTFEEVPAWTVVAEAVRGAVTPVAQRATTVVHADSPQVQREWMVTLPVGVAGVQVEDVVTVDASHSLSEGRVLTVRDVHHGTLAASLRLRCVENQTYPPEGA